MTNFAKVIWKQAALPLLQWQSYSLPLLKYFNRICQVASGRLGGSNEPCIIDWDHILHWKVVVVWYTESFLMTTSVYQSRDYHVYIPNTYQTRPVSS